MALLTRDQILDANDILTEEVKVPEWGGEVLVSVMEGNVRDNLELFMADQQKKGRLKSQIGIRAKYVSVCCVDENGERLFTDQDALALGKKSSLALDRVFDAACKLNGIGAKDVESLEKNSTSDQSDDSGSSSPEQ